MLVRYLFRAVGRPRMVLRWSFYGVVAVTVGILVVEWTGAVTHLAKAVSVREWETSAGDLLAECGYDRDRFEALWDASSDCVDGLRERVRLANTQGNWAVFAGGRGSGLLCVADILEAPDEMIVRLYAAWARRYRELLEVWPADMVITLALHRDHSCPRRPHAPG